MAIHNRKIEYRIKPVTRYIVTRYESGDHSNGAEQIGNEYDTADVAYQVGYAVCALEHQRLGWEIGDERIRYPEDPTSAVCTQQFAQIKGADAQGAKFNLPVSSRVAGLVAGTISGHNQSHSAE